MTVQYYKRDSIDPRIPCELAKGKGKQEVLTFNRESPEIGSERGSHMPQPLRADLLGFEAKERKEEK